ncbi:MAG: RNA-binding protein [Bacteroidales bacterium]|jgi:RNA recognition motif-containing protein|nr:RNA-binding protein [Bacteroidales bacterium]MDD4384958.1 RNA-binding protein [Bacteroidales bacterium]MDY0197933.1 RNA-binding protein [Tenuifilaceae bacterium]
MNIYFGNISYSMTPEEIKEIFSPYGNVLSVKIISDKQTGRSKGYAFVEMENDEDGEKAIKALNETEINGRNVKVNSAHRKESTEPQ